jgi:hypothetical protein
MNRGRRPGGGTPSGTSGKSSTRAVLVKPRSLAAQPPGTSGIPASLRKILCSLACAKHYPTFGVISLPCEPDMSWRRGFHGENQWDLTELSDSRRAISGHDEPSPGTWRYATPISKTAALFSAAAMSECMSPKGMAAKCVSSKCVAAKCVASTQGMTAIRCLHDFLLAVRPVSVYRLVSLLIYVKKDVMQPLLTKSREKGSRKRTCPKADMPKSR